jgi:16S rRNA (guanine527-N7)-methyltransferase
MKDALDPKEIESAVAALLEAGLSELAIPASSDQVSKLTRLVILLSEWASRISLTGHRDPLEMTDRLVLDAAALSNCLPELEAAENLADLGSGVGFPGLPIAILRPHLEVYLVESRLKRHHLQREIRRQLDLTRVIPILGRSNEVEVRLSDVVVAQAMTQPREALELMQPWVRSGGLVALPASESAHQPELPNGYGELSMRAYRVPTTGRERKLWVARVDAAKTL